MLPVATIIKTAGTPNASGKHESRPKQCTSCLSSGVKKDEARAPTLMAMVKFVMNCRRCEFCWGNRNWSPPKGKTHGFMPPVPTDMKNKPRRDTILENEKKLPVKIENLGPIFRLYLTTNCNENNRMVPSPLIR